MFKRRLMKIEDKKKNNTMSESAESSCCGKIAAEKKSKKAGFTLIELIVVVAVMAVLVGFSVASFASVNRRKATKIGKIIDSELSVLASHAYSRDGEWRLAFTYDESEECVVLTHEFKNSDNWVAFESLSLASDVDISFGGSDYDPDKSLKDDDDAYYVSVSREKGHYRTGNGYFCDKIFVHSSSKIVTIEMSPESGGHRVVS